MIPNWAGNINFTPSRELHPSSVDQVIAAVRDAELAGQRVRAIGSAWSFTDVIHTDGVLIRTDRLKQIHGFARGSSTWESRDLHVLRDAQLPDASPYPKRYVHFQAGLTVKELCARLDAPTAGRDRWALDAQGASSGQTVVDAATTDTHGGNWGGPPLADSIRAVHLVGGGGTQYWIEHSALRITDPDRLVVAVPGLRRENILYDTEQFNAALVAVGSLGVIVSVIVEVVEQFGLSQKVVSTRWSQIKAAWGLPEIVGRNCPVEHIFRGRSRHASLRAEEASKRCEGKHTGMAARQSRDSGGRGTRGSRWRRSGRRAA